MFLRFHGRVKGLEMPRKCYFLSCKGLCKKTDANRGNALLADGKNAPSHFDSVFQSVGSRGRVVSWTLVGFAPWSRSPLEGVPIPTVSPSPPPPPGVPFSDPPQWGGGDGARRPDVQPGRSGCRLGRQVPRQQGQIFDLPYGAPLPESASISPSANPSASLSPSPHRLLVLR